MTVILKLQKVIESYVTNFSQFDICQNFSTIEYKVKISVKIMLQMKIGVLKKLDFSIEIFLYTIVQPPIFSRN